MTRDHASAPRLACLLLPVLLLAALPGQAACPPEGHDRASLEALRAAGFQVAPPQREALASGLLDCLGDPDPGLRDGIAYEALMSWMRAGAFDPPVLRRLRDRLQAMLGQEDPAGFRGPFAALVLAEVARTDRIRPWMSRKSAVRWSPPPPHGSRAWTTTAASLRARVGAMASRMARTG